MSSLGAESHLYELVPRRLVRVEKEKFVILLASCYFAVGWLLDVLVEYNLAYAVGNNLARSRVLDALYMSGM